jgi:methyltransferase (TIGR00027 family)
MDAGAPSRTAEYMALFRALESARLPQRRLFEDRSAACFLRPGLRAVVRAARLPPLAWAACAYIDRRWPGPRPSGVVRTRVIDDFVVSAISGGCTQALLLGAGYDTRAGRLGVLASASVFEVDHPTTQRHKREALGATPRNVRYVPADLERDSLAAALPEAGFDRGQRTCVVWEGVFSYLTPEAIDLTLSVLVELCPPASRILLTYVDERALAGPQTARPAWVAAVQAVGEPFRTGLHPEHASAFFAQRGLCLRADESTTQAAHRLRAARAQTIPGFYRLATLELPAAADEEAGSACTRSHSSGGPIVDASGPKRAA